MTEQTIALQTRVYATPFHFRGVSAIPATLTPEQAALFKPTKITVKGAEADGFKRESEALSLSYDVPEGLHAGAIKAIESTLHLYAKEFADNYQPLPTVVDWALINDWLTTSSAGGAQFSAEFKKAALASIRAFIFKLTNREAVADGLAYVLSKGLTAASLMDAKGFRARATQLEGLYTQIVQLISAYAEDASAGDYLALVAVWAETLEARLAEVAAPEVELDLLG